MNNKEITTNDLMDFLVEFRDFAGENFATKEDLAKTDKRIDDLRNELRDEMHSGFYRLDSKIDAVEERLGKRIDDVGKRNFEDINALVQVTQKHEQRIGALESRIGV